jgi:hypothetical protein
VEHVEGASCYLLGVTRDLDTGSFKLLKQLVVGPVGVWPAALHDLIIIGQVLVAHNVPISRFLYHGFQKPTRTMDNVKLKCRLYTPAR